MNKAILVALVAAVIVIGGVAAYFYLDDDGEKEVEYSILGECNEPGIAIVTVTLLDDEEITEGYLTNGYQKDPITFVNRVGRVTYESPSYHVGVIPIPEGNLWLEIPGFSCHRV